MTPDTIKSKLAFLREAEQLKDVMRYSFTSKGRNESTAEHTWRLCLMAMVLEDDLQGVDIARVLKLCVVHDLGEAIHGDIPAVQAHEFPNKGEQERADLEHLTRELSDPLRTSLISLWEEYEAGKTPEAQAVKAMDKLETILQHNQGQNPPGFDYEFNLTYGEKYMDSTPIFRMLRQSINEETRQMIASQAK